MNKKKYFNEAEITTRIQNNEFIRSERFKNVVHYHCNNGFHARHPSQQIVATLG